MEIEKVLRIVATFIAIAAFALFVASRLMFPQSTLLFSPIAICVGLGLVMVCRDALKKTNEHTKK